MEREEIIRKISGRVEMCRRLARSTTDQQTAEALRQIADEGEADLRRLLAERSELEAPTVPKPEAEGDGRPA